jgi:NTP pyrophosphatase (non-canonical NTP hydrolase)
MTEFSNNLTPAELERLAYLAEECGEVVQIVMKILRHGYGDETTKYNNRELLKDEIIDVQKALYLMCKKNDIVFDFETLEEPTYKYMHHQ